MPHSLPREAARIARWFQGASDGARVQIVEMLSHRERGVGELAQALDMGQPLVSFHLKVLREAGWVRRSRDWRWICYAIQPDALDEIGRFMQTIKAGQRADPCVLDCCQPQRTLRGGLQL